MCLKLQNGTQVQLDHLDGLVLFTETLNVNSVLLNLELT